MCSPSSYARLRCFLVSRALTVRLFLWFGSSHPYACPLLYVLGDFLICHPRTARLAGPQREHDSGVRSHLRVLGALLTLFCPHGAESPPLMVSRPDPQPARRRRSDEDTHASQWGGVATAAPGVVH